MKGINLLPKDYQKVQRASRYERWGLGGLGILYLGSVTLMFGVPTYEMRAEKQVLQQITYRLQDTQFEEIKALSESYGQLQQQVTEGKMRIQSIAKEGLSVDPILDNILANQPRELGLERLSVTRGDRCVVLEGRAVSIASIFNMTKWLESIYPTGKVDFQIEESNKEEGYRFQILLLLGEAMSHETDES